MPQKKAQKKTRATMRVDITFQFDTPAELEEQINKIRSALAVIGKLTAAPDMKFVVNGADKTQELRLPVVMNTLQTHAAELKRQNEMRQNEMRQNENWQ